MARLESRVDLTANQAISLLPGKMYLEAYQKGNGYSYRTIFARSLMEAMIRDQGNQSALSEAGARAKGFGLVIEAKGMDVYVETKKG